MQTQGLTARFNHSTPKFQGRFELSAEQRLTLSNAGLVETRPGIFEHSQTALQPHDRQHLTAAKLVETKRGVFEPVENVVDRKA